MKIEKYIKQNYGEANFLLEDDLYLFSYTIFTTKNGHNNKHFRIELYNDKYHIISDNVIVRIDKYLNQLYIQNYCEYEENDLQFYNSDTTG